MPAYLDAILSAMRAYPDLLQVSGVLGSIIYVGGFALVQSGKACGNSAAYSMSKVIAATLVLISLVGAFNLSAFLIQIGFIGFGVLGLVRQIRERASTGHPASTPPIAYAPRGPVFQDSEQGTSDWGNHPRARAYDRPIQPFPDAAAPTL